MTQPPFPGLPPPSRQHRFWQSSPNSLLLSEILVWKFILEQYFLPQVCLLSMFSFAHQLQTPLFLHVRPSCVTTSLNRLAAQSHFLLVLLQRFQPSFFSVFEISGVRRRIALFLSWVVDLLPLQCFPSFVLLRPFRFKMGILANNVKADYSAVLPLSMFLLLTADLSGKVFEF